MIEKEAAFYLGEEKEKGYSGVVVEENFFVVFEAEEGISAPDGREFMKSLKEKLLSYPISNLADLDGSVADTIKDRNLPAHFSISAGYIKNNILYLKTSGQGEIVIKRKNKVAPLINGNISASGYFEVNDIFVFTTSRFMDVVGGEEKLSHIFDHKTPQEIVAEVTPILKAENDQGAVAIFVQFKKDEITEQQEILPMGFVEKFRDSFKEYYLRQGKKKTLTFITVFIIFLIFFWSVVLGYQRRNDQAATEKIKTTHDLIVQKISEAEDVSYINMSSALSLLADSKKQLADLKKAYPKRKEIADIEKIVSDGENKILKKEEKNYSEFFDLAIDNQKAKGDRLYLDGSDLFILDKANSTLYDLNLDKKSLDKNQVQELKDADLIASYSGKKYFYLKSIGIYTIDDNGKAKKIIDNDPDWGAIADMYIFNGNIYLMDKGKDQIYKYVPGDNGFSNKVSYLASGQSVDLSSFNSMAIDSSVYLGGGGDIIKFTSGLRDGFKVALPDSSFNINKVFAAKDLTNVYAWDKAKGMIYIMDKSGEFIKQVQSSILSQGADFVIYKESIYILSGGKIYKID